MFSITADGTIFHDGVEIGSIRHDSTYGREDRQRDYTVRGLFLEEVDEKFFGGARMVRSTSLKAGGAVHRSATAEELS